MLYENLKVEPNTLPIVSEMEFDSHPRAYLRMRLLMKGIIVLILIGGIVGAWMNNDILMRSILLTVVLGTMSLALIVTELKSFPLRGYLIRENDISYRKGWIFRSLTTVPFNRIQHSEVSQGPVSRAFGLSSLNIFTAGGSSSDLSISGLRPEEAERLRDWITQKVANHV